MLSEICALVFLSVNSWLDVKKKEISLAAVGIFGFLGLLIVFYRRGFSCDLLVPVGISAGVMGLSIVTGGAVGMGDGLVLMVLALLLNGGKFLAVLFMGLLGCGICSLIMLLVFQKEKKYEIPFVPFILLSYVGGLILW